jgi:hypothetical protein
MLLHESIPGLSVLGERGRVKGATIVTLRLNGHGLILYTTPAVGQNRVRAPLLPQILGVTLEVRDHGDPFQAFCQIDPGELPALVSPRPPFDISAEPTNPIRNVPSPR